MPFLQNFAFARTMVVVALIALHSPAALACGGGGSGGYRKPVRPEHFTHQASPQASSIPSADSATPTPATPANGF